MKRTPWSIKEAATTPPSSLVGYSAENQGESVPDAGPGGCTQS